MSFSHLDIGNVRFKCARFCWKAIIGTIVIAGSDFRKVVPFCPLVSCKNRLIKFSVSVILRSKVELVALSIPSLSNLRINGPQLFKP